MHFVFINPPREIKGNNIWSIINSVNPPLGWRFWRQSGINTGILPKLSTRPLCG